MLQKRRRHDAWPHGGSAPIDCAQELCRGRWRKGTTLLPSYRPARVFTPLEAPLAGAFLGGT